MLEEGYIDHAMCICQRRPFLNTEEGSTLDIQIPTQGQGGK